MKSLRIGTDRTIVWRLFCGGEAYDLSGKELLLKVSAPGSSFVVDEDFSIEGNIITWIFRGKDQKTLGPYTLTLIENNGKNGMVSFDLCDAFSLVACSCQEKGDNDADLSISGIELSSELGINAGTGSSTADMPFSKGAGKSSSVLKGGENIASGELSCAEGFHTETGGNYDITTDNYERPNPKEYGSSMMQADLDDNRRGLYAHAEGCSTIANGPYSHAEGNLSFAYGLAAHAEGHRSFAYGNFSHAEGNKGRSIGKFSHAEGNDNWALGEWSHVEGSDTKAYSRGTHAEGYNSIAGAAPNEETGKTKTNDELYAEAFSKYHPESKGGASSTTSGVNEEDTVIEGHAAHSEGHTTVAHGRYSHAEGSSTTAIGDRAHAEGWQNIAFGIASHAEGLKTIAKGHRAHAEGGSTQALGTNSHAEGYGTRTSPNNVAEHAEGRFNKSTAYADNPVEGGTTIHSVGIGENESSRKNAHEILRNGEHYIINVGGYDGTNPRTATDLASIITQLLLAAHPIILQNGDAVPEYLYDAKTDDFKYKPSRYGTVYPYFKISYEGKLYDIIYQNQGDREFIFADTYYPGAELNADEIHKVLVNQGFININ